MKDYGTEVKLLAITGLSKGFQEELYSGGGYRNESEDLVEYAGRLCYDAEKDLGNKPGWIQSRVKAGHESIIEHASATFYIKASRVFTHELVRHRIASYSQRSQRYVKEGEPKYITPPGLEAVKIDAEYADRVFSRAMKTAWYYYRQLLTGGVSKEIARYVLPNACETQIVVTMNFRELRHFIKLRTSPKALPEMREVAGKIKDICKDIAPKVFEGV